MLVTAEDALSERRQLREIDRAVEPEPRDAEHRAPDDEILLRDLEIPPCFGERIPVDRERRRDGGRQRDLPAREPAGNRDDDRERPRKQRSVGLDRNDDAAGDRAEKNG